MADTTANDTIDIGTKLSMLEQAIAKTNENLVRFSGAVTSLLSGQPISGLQAPAKRRGRPPKASTDRIPETVATPKPKELHPMAQQALTIVERAGRITQTELAAEMKVERSQVEYHCLSLVEAGRIVSRTVKPRGVKTILYYRHDWASFKGE